ncbi:hypothetical protein BBJ28_00012285 [Nothophytophthora sp. Chile5]|nr:hypothetical protein BBJ28_00012285 [Nothophytophthora sp. Chile5]
MTSAVEEQRILENEKELAGAWASPSLRFAKGDVTAISPVLERVLLEMRQTGVPCYAWEHLKVLLLAKLKLALDQVHAGDKQTPTPGVGWSPTNRNNRFDERCANVTGLLNTFEGPPFTLQRLTEIIMEPEKSYKSLHKLINALEKLLAVSSTIQVVNPRTAPAIVQQFRSPSPTEVDSPIARPIPQTVEGVGELDVAARAPWSGTETAA